MRRFAIVLMLAACGSTEPGPECHFALRSQMTNTPADVVSGREIIGVSWLETIGENAPINHGALVFADGTRTPDIHLGQRQIFGTAGTASVLWHSPHDGKDCLDLAPFDVVLHRADGMMHFKFGTSLSRTATFDGTAFQLFWVTVNPPKLLLQSLGEDGTLGAVHELVPPPPGSCVEVASDRAGTTFLRVNNDNYLVDTATGAMQHIWSGGSFELFYFGGKWRLPGFSAMTSIAPDGTSEEQPFTGDLQTMSRRFYAGTSTLYVNTPASLLEVDASLTTRSLHRRGNDLGTFGDDRVYFDRFSIDGQNLIPGHIVVTREGSTPWQMEVAMDSPVESVEECTEK